MARSRRIDWACDVCGEPLWDGAGYVTVGEADVKEVVRADAEFRKKGEEAPGRPGWPVHRASDFAKLPEPARWLFRHHACDPAPDAPDYWFDIAEIRTEAALLSKTAQLMEKEWLTATNWIDVIRDCGGPDRA